MEKGGDNSSSADKSGQAEERKDNGHKESVPPVERKSRFGRRIREKRFQDFVIPQQRKVSKKSAGEDVHGITEEEVRPAEVVNVEDRQLIRMNRELRLIKLNTQIRTCLNTIDPKLDACLDLLDELLRLEVTPVMLKKNPEVINTFRRIVRYTGNPVELNKKSEREVEEFKTRAGLIRTKGKRVLSKFENLFRVPEGEKFVKVFHSELKKFIKKTRGMTIQNFCALVDEPK